MFNEMIAEASSFFDTARGLVPVIIKPIAFIWLIHLVNTAMGGRLNIFGIHSRKWYGIPGILLAPLLHGNFNHLFFNSLPLFMLGLLVASLNTEYFVLITLVLVIFNGVIVWLLGRRANHIGASGLVCAYFGYGLTMAYIEPTGASLMLGFVAIYYFGSIFLSLVPTEEGVSWESHLGGFVAGVLTAKYWTAILILIQTHIFLDYPHLEEFLKIE